MLVVAVDGYAASGKGTISAHIANVCNIPHLDTGKLYRGLALWLLEKNYVFSSSENISIYLKQCKLDIILGLSNDSQINLESVGKVASQISKFQEVRLFLLNIQRRFANRSSGAVLDGRDIGTVVLPDADVKIFVTADLKVRTLRRARELRVSDKKEVKKLSEMLKQRDKADKEREFGPLLPAIDSILLDTTKLNLEDACNAAIDIVKQKSKIILKT